MTTLQVDSPWALPHPVASSAVDRPGQDALVFEGECWSAHALLEKVKARAASFAEAGVKAGDRVAMLAGNHPSFIVDLHALGWLGAVVMPVNPKMPVVEMERALGILKADVWVAHEREDVWKQVAEASCGRWLWPVTSAKPAPPERFWPLDEPRFVLLTSGSTGAPRAVEVLTGQLMTSAFGSAIRLGHDREDRWLCALPLYHIGGLSILMRCAWYGTTVVLHTAFDAKVVAQAMDAGEVSQVSLVPAMLERVLDSREDVPFPSSLRVVLLGGAPASAQLVARCGALGVPLSTTWGMTEASSQITTRAPGDTEARLDSGAPLAFARVSEEDDRLVVRGPVVKGVWATSDRGVLDMDGRVQVLGRMDDVILSGGENLDPAEVEAVLEAHPSVARAAVIGLEDEDWGQRPVAVLVKAKQNEQATLDVLRAWCKARLAAWKAPDAVRWVEALPEVTLGKVSRAGVRVLWEDVINYEQELLRERQDKGEP